jgi:hypothetical protein
MVLEKVVSGEYSLTGSEYYGWSRYMKEERKYPIVDSPKLQESIESEEAQNKLISLALYRAHKADGTTHKNHVVGQRALNSTE